MTGLVIHIGVISWRNDGLSVTNDLRKKQTNCVENATHEM
jgi:hypothetical protein